MPEGHSIHRLAQQFGSVFVGRALAVSSPQGRFAAGAERLDGGTLVAAEAHGKQLFLRFDHDLYLRVHLGLYGAWDFGGDRTFRGASSIGAPRRVGETEVPAGPSAGVPDAGDLGVGDARAGDSGDGEAYAGPPPPVGAVRVRLVSEHGWADLRGASVCEVLTEAEAAAVVGRLGPDPLQGEPQQGESLTLDGLPPAGRRAEFCRRLRVKASPVAVLLMDQKIIAGVGNVYRAEALFRLRLNPWRTGASMSAELCAQLWDDVAAMMADGVRDGRMITTDPADRGSDEVPVPQDEAHYVYKREGLRCRRCGAVIALAPLASRKLYWCPGCQGNRP